MKTIRIELSENVIFALLIVGTCTVLGLVSMHHTERFKAAIAAGYSEATLQGATGTSWVKTK